MINTDIKYFKIDKFVEENMTLKGFRLIFRDPIAKGGKKTS